MPPHRDNKWKESGWMPTYAGHLPNTSAYKKHKFWSLNLYRKNKPFDLDLFSFPSPMIPSAILLHVRDDHPHTGHHDGAHHVDDHSHPGNRKKHVQILEELDCRKLQEHFCTLRYPLVIPFIHQDISDAWRMHLFCWMPGATCLHRLFIYTYIYIYIHLFMYLCI